MAHSNRKPGIHKPISSHPLFPAVVGLWFGALFGLGSLAIRTTLMESVVLNTGIDLVIPAAAPPLGITARILIALVMASLGAALGVVLTLRLNRPKTVVRERKRTAGGPGLRAGAETGSWNRHSGPGDTDGPARRPISAHEELGDAFDSPAAPGNRRRTLAVEHEEQPFQPQEVAPLPGGDPQMFNIAMAPLDPLAPAAAPVEELAPLDLAAFAAPVEAALPVPPAQSQPQPQPQPQPMLDWTAAPIAIAAQAPAPAAPAQAVFAMQDLAPMPACLTPHDQALAMDFPMTTEPQSGPVGSTGMTDLTARLQESMARRRAAKAAAAALAAETMAAEPLGIQPSAPDPAPAPAPLPTSIPMPAALRPITFEPEDEQDFELMPRHLAMPQGAAPQPVQDEAFASLLDIQPPRQEFVRIEQPDEPVMAIEPVVIFPGQMAAAQPVPMRPFDAPSPAIPGSQVTAAPAARAIDPAAAELALRSALANLQRISGVA